MAPSIGFWVYSHGWIWLCAGTTALNLTMAAIAWSMEDDRTSGHTHGAFDVKHAIEWRVVALSTPLFLYTYSYGAVSSFSAYYATALGIHPRAVYLTTMALVTLLSRPIAGRFGDRIGHRRLFMPSLVVIATGMVVLAFADTRAGLIAAAALFALGFGTAYPAFAAWVMLDIHDSRRAAFGAVWRRRRRHRLGLHDHRLAHRPLGVQPGLWRGGRLAALALPTFLLVERRFGPPWSRARTTPPPGDPLYARRRSSDVGASSRRSSSRQRSLALAAAALECFFLAEPSPSRSARAPRDRRCRDGGRRAPWVNVGRHCAGTLVVCRASSRPLVPTRRSYGRPARARRCRGGIRARPRVVQAGSLDPLLARPARLTPTHRPDPRPQTPYHEHDLADVLAALQLGMRQRHRAAEGRVNDQAHTSPKGTCGCTFSSSFAHDALLDWRVAAASSPSASAAFASAGSGSARRGRPFRKRSGRAAVDRERVSRVPRRWSPPTMSTMASTFLAAGDLYDGLDDHRSCWLMARSASALAGRA
jgi:hypothetical protein